MEITQIVRLGALIVIGGTAWAVISAPFASMLGKHIKRRATMVNPYKVHDMRGGSIGMNFYIADLMHDAQKSRPEQGDAVIVLDICGMGMTVTRDRRGNVTSEFSTPQPPAPGDILNPRREFDTFDVHLNGEGDTTFKRYEFRPLLPGPENMGDCAVMFWIILTISGAAAILILLALAIIGLLSTAISQLRIIAGALSMLATTFDERVPGDEAERVFFQRLARAIYHGVVDGAFQVKQG